MNKKKGTYKRSPVAPRSGDLLDGSHDLLPFDKKKFTRRSNIKDQMTAEEFRNMAETEGPLQTECEQYLKDIDITYIHIPQNVYATGKAKSLTGIPDLLIFKRTDDHNDILCIELKSKTGKRHQSQINWPKKQQLIVHVVRSFPRFQKIVDGFINA